MNRLAPFCAPLFGLIALAALGGCNDPLARQEVSGEVTLKGQPVEDGVIQFAPLGRVRTLSVSAFPRQLPGPRSPFFFSLTPVAEFADTSLDARDDDGHHRAGIADRGQGPRGARKSTRKTFAGMGQFPSSSGDRCDDELESWHWKRRFFPGNGVVLAGRPAEAVNKKTHRFPAVCIYPRKTQ
jgi:hypothetical protein